MDGGEHFQQCNDDYLSLNCSKGLKGIFALFILFHHVCIYTSNLHIPYVGIVTSGYLGYWSVSIFFFFSGYGLWYSYTKGGDEYIDLFLHKRILPYETIVIIFVAIYTLLNLFVADAKVITVELIIQSFFWGKTVITNGWYLQVQLWIYICFYLLVKIVREQKRILFWLSLTTVVYLVSCMAVKIDAYWYVASPCFLMGILWCNYRKKIDRVILLNGSVVFAIAVCLFACFFGAIYFCVKVDFEMARIVFSAMSNLAFVLCVLLVMVRSYKNKIFNSRGVRFAGRVSFEIYVVQGIFLIALRGTKIYITNDYLYASAVVMCTIFGAAAISPLFEKIYDVCRKRI